MYQAPLRTYEKVSQTTVTGREVEAAVLTKAAVRLKECQSQWDQVDGGDRLIAALKFNQRVWSILQVEINRPENPLPHKLKIDLLRLSAFVDKRIFEIMAYPAPEKLTILININNNIAAGLRTRNPQAANTKAAA